MRGMSKDLFLYCNGVFLSLFLAAFIAKFSPNCHRFIILCINIEEIHQLLLRILHGTIVFFDKGQIQLMFANTSCTAVNCKNMSQ